MITNPERFAERHRRICARAEQQFAEKRANDPKFTVPKAVKAYAAAVRLALSGRDTIAAVYAAQCAHLAMKAPLDFAKSTD